MLTLDDIIVMPPEAGVVVDPVTWFDTPGPLEIEIGSGKGGFLLSRAMANPDLRLLGIEWANKYFRHAADRMARREVGNVRMMRTDAGHFFQHHLPPGCVSVLHVYHPDPWPKARHHKRRLVQPAFIEAAVVALKPGGFWLIQSDHEEYFHVIRELLDQHERLEGVAWEATGVDLGEEWGGTNFEIKYTREGRTIYRSAYRNR